MSQQPPPGSLPDPTAERTPTAADREFARTVPTAVQSIRALAEGRCSAWPLAAPA